MARPSWGDEAPEVDGRGGGSPLEILTALVEMIRAGTVQVGTFALTLNPVVSRSTDLPVYDVVYDAPPIFDVQFAFTGDDGVLSEMQRLAARARNRPQPTPRRLGIGYIGARTIQEKNDEALSDYDAMMFGKSPKKKRDEEAALQDAKNALAAQKEQFNKDYAGTKTFNNDTQGRADQAKWGEEIKNALNQLTQAQQRIAQAEIDAKKTRSASFGNPISSTRESQMTDRAKPQSRQLIFD